MKMKSEWNDNLNLKRLIKHKKKQKGITEANKLSQEADKKVEEANKQVKQMVRKMYEDGFSLDQISEYCSLNVDEIQVLIKS